MRPLRRPMFRTGGPIGEGVMHGMNGLQNGGTVRHMNGLANGGRTIAGGNQIGIPMGSRTGFQDPVPGGSTFWSRLADQYRPKNFASPKKFFQRIVPWKRGKSIATAPKQIQGAWGILQSKIPKGGISGSTTGQTFMKNLKDFSFQKPKFLEGIGTKIGGFYSRAPKKRIAASLAAAPYVIQGAKKLPFEAIGDFVTHPVKEWGKVFGIGKNKDDGDDKVLTEDEKKIQALQKQIELMNKSKEKTPAEIKVDKENQLNKIYNLLGVDRAKSNAASKALIDMSRYIDEGGKDVISKKNIGSTISKAIGAFDKRLDKVDQLKEASGLMLAKAEVENMMDPLGKESKRMSIALAKDKLYPGVNSALTQAKTIKRGPLSEQETVDAVRSGAANEGLELIEAISSDQIDDGNYKGKTVIDIVTDLQPEDGYYVIGKSIIKVESGVPQLKEGPLTID